MTVDRRDDVRLLGELIDLADKLLRKPSYALRQPLADMTTIVAERAKSLSPDTGVRTASLLLCRALGEIVSLEWGAHARQELWCNVAEALLVIVRADLAQAMQVRPSP